MENGLGPRESQDLDPAGATTQTPPMMMRRQPTVVSYASATPPIPPRASWPAAGAGKKLPSVVEAFHAMSASSRAPASPSLIEASRRAAGPVVIPTVPSAAVAAAAVPPAPAPRRQASIERGTDTGGSRARSPSLRGYASPAVSQSSRLRDTSSMPALLSGSVLLRPYSLQSSPSASTLVSRMQSAAGPFARDASPPASATLPVASRSPSDAQHRMQRSVSPPPQLSPVGPPPDVQRTRRGPMRERPVLTFGQSVPPRPLRRLGRGPATSTPTLTRPSGGSALVPGPSLVPLPSPSCSVEAPAAHPMRRPADSLSKSWQPTYSSEETASAAAQPVLRSMYRNSPSLPNRRLPRSVSAQVVRQPSIPPVFRAPEAGGALWPAAVANLTDAWGAIAQAELMKAATPTASAGKASAATKDCTKVYCGKILFLTSLEPMQEKWDDTEEASLNEGAEAKEQWSEGATPKELSVGRASGSTADAPTEPTVEILLGAQADTTNGARSPAEFSDEDVNVHGAFGTPDPESMHGISLAEPGGDDEDRLSSLGGWESDGNEAPDDSRHPTHEPVSQSNFIARRPALRFRANVPRLTLPPPGVGTVGGLDPAAAIGPVAVPAAAAVQAIAGR